MPCKHTHVGVPSVTRDGIRQGIPLSSLYLSVTRTSKVPTLTRQSQAFSFSFSPLSSLNHVGKIQTRSLALTCIESCVSRPLVCKFHASPFQKRIGSTMVHSIFQRLNIHTMSCLVIYGIVHQGLPTSSPPFSFVSVAPTTICERERDKRDKFYMVGFRRAQIKMFVILTREMSPLEFFLHPIG